MYVCTQLVYTVDLNFSSLGGGVDGTTNIDSGVGFRSFRTMFHIEKNERPSSPSKIFGCMPRLVSVKHQGLACDFNSMGRFYVCTHTHITVGRKTGPVRKSWYVWHLGPVRKRKSKKRTRNAFGIDWQLPITSGCIKFRVLTFDFRPHDWREEEKEKKRKKEKKKNLCQYHHIPNR